MKNLHLNQEKKLKYLLKKEEGFQERLKTLEHKRRQKIFLTKVKKLKKLTEVKRKLADMKKQQHKKLLNNLNKWFVRDCKIEKTRKLSFERTKQDKLSEAKKK